MMTFICVVSIALSLVQIPALALLFRRAHRLSRGQGWCYRDLQRVLLRIGEEALLQNRENADLNGDGRIDTYDVHLFLARLSAGLPVSLEDRRILVDFYKHALVGVVSDWLEQGMKEDLSAVIRRIGVLLEGNIRRALENSIADE